MFSGREGSLIRMSQICGMSTAAPQLYFRSLWCSHVKPLASYLKVNTRDLGSEYTAWIYAVNKTFGCFLCYTY